MPINLDNIYYIFLFITNLVFSSLLLKKCFYFHDSKYTLNRISNDKKIAYTPMINRVFALQVVYTSVITLFSQDFLFTWHLQLGYIGLDNLKKILREQSLNR